jgi:hypothetical protein
VFGGLKKSALRLAQGAAPQVTCPRCQHRFKPFADVPPASFSQLTHTVPCPHCSHVFAFADGTRAMADARANPPGPFVKPAETRIEMQADAGGWVYKIPRGRHSWGAVTMMVLCNVCAWGIVGISLADPAPVKLPFIVMSSLFCGGGLILIYTTARLHLATHRLTLSPQTIRLRRKLVLRKDYELPIDEITGVRKREFYSENYQPVYGIEITAGSRRIRFGSTLTEDEKNWLCWQIREFVHQHGAPLGD